MSKNLFVLGTGTDIGKSYISALIIKKLLNAGIKAGYFKPVSSGNKCRSDGSLELLDVGFVREFAGLNLSDEQMSAYAYEHAYSPHLSAKFEGNAPEMSTIRAKFDAIAAKCDLLIVEGAGGAICPIRYDEKQHIMLLDIVRELDCAALIVADAGLGGINAAVLTTKYLHTQNIELVGIILNNFDAANKIHTDNKTMIENLSGVGVLDVVAQGQAELNLSADELAGLFG